MEKTVLQRRYPKVSGKGIWGKMVAVWVTALLIGLLGFSVGIAQPAELPSGEHVTMRFVIPSPAMDPVRNECGKMLARNWQELGIDVELQQFDYSGLYDTVSQPPYDYSAFILGFVSRPERLDPDVLLYWPFHSSGIRAAGTNFAAFSMPKYDELLDAQRREMDMDSRQRLVWDCQEILNQYVPAIPLYHVVSAVAHSKGRFNGWTSMIGYNFWNVWNLINLEPTTEDSVVRFGKVQGDIVSSNPLNFANGQNPDEMRLIYDKLTRNDADGVPIPAAAESWEVLDPSTILMHLRHGMSFHDGKPVTAWDVKFSFEYLTKWEQPELSPFTKRFADIEVIDDYTLKMMMDGPNPAVFQTTFAMVYILPEHIWENVVEEHGLTNPIEWDSPHPVGSGPFEWGYWKQGEELYLEANETHYWAPKTNFLLIDFSNQEALFFALMSGDIDFHERRLIPEQVDEAEQNPNLALYKLPDFGVYYMGFNGRQVPAKDILFRQALGYTVDYDFIVDVVLKGYGSRGYSFIAPVNKFWSNPYLVLRTFDMRLARELLEQAGYTWNEKGELLYPKTWRDAETRFQFNAEE